jgi:hypothetical protein
MTVYRIYTENGADGQHMRNVRRLASARMTGFTVTTGTGYWNGMPEPCIILEHIGGDDMHENVRALAYDIRDENNQDTVLVTAHKLESFELCGG